MAQREDPAACQAGDPGGGVGWVRWRRVPRAALPACVKVCAWMRTCGMPMTGWA
jgi:hypothetical protein